MSTQLTMNPSREDNDSGIGHLLWVVRQFARAEKRNFNCLRTVEGALEDLEGVSKSMGLRSLAKCVVDCKVS